ncbi:hypothetical protein [Methylobacterium sp. A52T]
MATRLVNNFEMKTEAGKQVWYWQDSVGSQCGRDRKWRYEVQAGDTVQPDLGQCPQGYAWQEVTISGRPVQV